MPSPKHPCQDCKTPATRIRCRKCFNVWRKKMNNQKTAAAATPDDGGQLFGMTRKQAYTESQGRQKTSAVNAPRSWWITAPRQGFTDVVRNQELDRMRESMFGRTPPQINWGD